MNKTCLIHGTPVQELPFGYDEEDELCVAIKLKIAEIVSQLATNGITDFVTDCEYGIPLWGAEVVLAQKIFTLEITLKVYLPHEEQAVKWSPDWRNRYFTLHEKADDVVIFNDYEKCMESRLVHIINVTFAKLSINYLKPLCHFFKLACTFKRL